MTDLSLQPYTTLNNACVITCSRLFFTKCKKNWAHEVKHVAEEIDQLDVFFQLYQFDLDFA